jgi:hypothetical protein
MGLHMIHQFGTVQTELLFQRRARYALRSVVRRRKADHVDRLCGNPWRRFLDRFVYIVL